jgi:hypothetical protein
MASIACDELDLDAIPGMNSMPASPAPARTLPKSPTLMRVHPISSTPARVLPPNSLPDHSRSVVSPKRRFLIDDGFKGTIVSIGSHTDAIVDRYNLDDKLLTSLRVLSKTVRSSKWEAELRDWGLNFEQASKLSSAMLADLDCHAPSAQIKVCVTMV